MIDPNATPSDLHYTAMLIEVIGAKLNEEMRRADLFAKQGREDSTARSDGAACALREILMAVVASRRFYGAVPPRLDAWSKNGSPWVWPLLPAGESLAVVWCGDENPS